VTDRTLAVFDDPVAVRRAVEAMREAGFGLIEVFSPYRLEGLAPLEPQGRAIGWAAFLGGALGGGGVFALESFSAVRAYAFDSGGRPPFSWPVFTLAAFEIGVLCAGVCAFVAFMIGTGFPRLNHPAFDIDGLERASQDRFFLIFAKPEDDERREHQAALLSGAVEVREVSL
jgi:hypothetical protein